MNEESNKESIKVKTLKTSLILPRLNNLTKENKKFNRDIDLKNIILKSLIKLNDDLTADIGLKEMKEIIDKIGCHEEDIELILSCLVDKTKVGNPFNIVYIEGVLTIIDFIIKLHEKKIKLQKIFMIRSFVMELLPISKQNILDLISNIMINMYFLSKDQMNYDSATKTILFPFLEIFRSEGNLNILHSSSLILSQLCNNLLNQNKLEFLRSFYLFHFEEFFLKINIQYLFFEMFSIMKIMAKIALDLMSEKIQKSLNKILHIVNRNNLDKPTLNQYMNLVTAANILQIIAENSNNELNHIFEKDAMIINLLKKISLNKIVFVQKSAREALKSWTNAKNKFTNERPTKILEENNEIRNNQGNDCAEKVFIIVFYTQDLLKKSIEISDLKVARANSKVLRQKSVEKPVNCQELELKRKIKGKNFIRKKMGLGGGFYAISMNEEKKDINSLYPQKIEKEQKSIKNFIRESRKMFNSNKRDELSFGETGVKFETVEIKVLSQQDSKLIKEKTQTDFFSSIIKEEESEKLENNSKTQNKKTEKNEEQTLFIECGEGKEEKLILIPEEEKKSNNSPKSETNECFDNQNVEDSLFMEEKENLGDQALFSQQEDKKKIILYNQTSKDKIKKKNSEKNDMEEIESGENNIDKVKIIVGKKDNTLIDDILKEDPFSNAPQEINDIENDNKESPNFKTNLQKEIEVKSESFKLEPDTEMKNYLKEEEKKEKKATNKKKIARFLSVEKNLASLPSKKNENKFFQMPNSLDANRNAIKDIINKESILSNDKFSKYEENLKKREKLLFPRNNNTSETMIYKSSTCTLKEEEEKDNTFFEEENLYHESSDKINIDDFYKILETEENQPNINKISYPKEKNDEIDFSSIQKENEYELLDGWFENKMQLRKKEEKSVGGQKIKKIPSCFEKFLFKIMSEVYQEKEIYDSLLIEEQNEILNILKLKS